jgi:hypothetical protein
MALISFDFKQTDPVKAKAAVNALCDWAEGGVITAGNWDKTLIFDNLKKAAEAGIDSLYKQGPLVVGAAVTTEVEAANFVAGFPGVPQATADFVKANPMVVDRMVAKRKNGKAWFEFAEQEAMLQGVGGVDWMQLLLTLAPIVIKILLSLFL